MQVWQRPSPISFEATSTGELRMIEWGPPQDQALEALKTALSSPPTLAYPDFARPFLLYVDASKQAFAAALHQCLPATPSTPPAVAALAGSDERRTEKLNRTKSGERAGLNGSYGNSASGSDSPDIEGIDGEGGICHGGDQCHAGTTRGPIDAQGATEREHAGVLGSTLPKD
ncbi:uncharacterized protein MEPE_04888 [Melanopsichium pennsylvanicum]|uniref:Reverse transcriptase/retrotransposon-derived protein RNase H-like domain-containing protein n=1 Tax=Melanopsichium pennsylvanicum TaxID=63383 RepID=A0AAJ4XPL7_9BASI|nr:uncharacterized protein MEPE_04888 [Melanopsichium pennsylvanicum]